MLYSDNFGVYFPTLFSGWSFLQIVTNFVCFVHFQWVESFFSSYYSNKSHFGQGVNF
jgi:hypothetical protein